MYFQYFSKVIYKGSRTENMWCDNLKSEWQPNTDPSIIGAPTTFVITLCLDNQMVFNDNSLGIHFQSIQRRVILLHPLCEKYNCQMKWCTASEILPRVHNNIKEMNLLESTFIISSYSKTGWESTEYMGVYLYIVTFSTILKMTPIAFLWQQDMGCLCGFKA